jgi:hypothetical protein
VNVGHEVRSSNPIQSSLRDGVIVILLYPALKDRAKFTRRSATRTSQNSLSL